VYAFPVPVAPIRLVRNRNRKLLRAFLKYACLVGLRGTTERFMQYVSLKLRDLLTTADLSRPACNIVLQRLGAPPRRYHGLDHIALLWARHRRFGHGTPVAAPHASRLIACAIAFHDAIYDPRRSDNEHRSALLWRRWAPPDLSAADTSWVAAAIEATADHLAPRPAATQRDRLLLWMLDLDLTPLGEPPPLFARNSRDLRIEYRHMSEADWQRGRQAFMRKLHAAPLLFRSRPLAIRFEQSARRNVARALAGADRAAASRSALHQ
jgi:predicted metal-dependent HD superfamily phosphohydrolase